MNNAVKILTYCSACFITELLAILAAVFIEQMKTNKKLKQKDNNSRYNFRKKNREARDLLAIQKQLDSKAVKLESSFD